VGVAAAQMSSSARTVVLAVVAVCSVVVGAVAVILVGRADSEMDSVVLVGAADVGPDPFLPGVAGTSIGEAEQVQVVLASSEPVPGETPGLYERAEASPCDPSRLAELIGSDPDVSRTWAGIAGVGVDEVGATIAAMAPVRLTADTVVTNHAYRDGEAEAFVAVLQSGSDVLVDATGAPRVKCNCGNPLLPATVAAESAVVGRPWPGFDASAVQAIAPAPEPVTELVVVDESTGEPATVGVGPAGEPTEEAGLDGYLAVDDEGVSVLAPDGTVTPVFDDPVLSAADDGAGGLVVGYPPATDDDQRTASIWIRRAGVADPVAVIPMGTDPAVSEGLNGVVEVVDRRLLAFTVVDQSIPGEPLGDLRFLDLDSGEIRVLDTVGTIGPEHSPGDVTSDGDVILVPEWTAVGRSFSLLDTDLEALPVPQWTDTACAYPDSCRAPMALDDAGRVWMFDDTSSDGVLALASVDASTGAMGGPISLGVAHDGYAQLDVRGDEAVVSFDGLDAVPNARHVDLATGEVTELSTTARLTFLRAPLDRSLALDAAPVPDDEAGPAVTAIPTDLRGRIFGYVTDYDPTRDVITVDVAEYYEHDGMVEYLAETGDWSGIICDDGSGDYPEYDGTQPLSECEMAGANQLVVNDDETPVELSLAPEVAIEVLDPQGADGLRSVTKAEFEQEIADPEFDMRSYHLTIDDDGFVVALEFQFFS